MPRPVSSSRDRQSQAVELPELDAGIRLLEVYGDGRGTGPLQSLVLDHLLMQPGEALWVDAGGHATTSSLAPLAPSQRLLDRIQVARGFTPHQHYELIQRLTDEITGETSLLVIPDFDRPYREAETYADEGEDLLLRSLAMLAGLGNRHDIPVLVTPARRDAFSEPVTVAARETLECRQTKFGPRFTGDEFETLVYPVGQGMLQTTIAFWQRVLQQRQTTVSASGTPATGVIVDGTH